jgi:Tol biopolymer transport system component
VKQLRSLFSNTGVLLLIAALAVGLAWLLGSRAAQKAAETVSTDAISQSPLATPVPATPPATATHPVIPVIVTVFPTPTPAPSPTPTATFEPLSDKPIEGYIFGPPELIAPRGYIEIAGWLPGSSEELIVSDFEDEHYLVEFLNVKTGQRQRVVETSQNIVGKPVWLPAVRQMAYLAQDKSGALNLYLSSAAGKPNSSTLALGNLSSPLAPAPDGKNVLVFDNSMRQLLRVGQETPVARRLSVADLPSAGGTGPFARYQDAWSDKTDWLAYYSPEKFVLINSQTGESRNVDLGKTSPGIEKFWAAYATWSPDGQRLALVVTSDSPFQTISFTQLAIFDLSTGNLQLIKDNFAYVTNVAWSPDKSNVLISATTGQLDGYDISALFLVNIDTGQISPVPVAPKDALGFSPFSSLAWSPDGKQVIVGYAERPGKSGWYHVNVRMP